MDMNSFRLFIALFLVCETVLFVTLCLREDIAEIIRKKLENTDKRPRISLTEFVVVGLNIAILFALLKGGN